MLVVEFVRCRGVRRFEFFSRLGGEEGGGGRGETVNLAVSESEANVDISSGER